MPRKKADTPENAVSLHVGPTFLSGWETVLAPWFKSVALKSVKSGRQVAVVTPFASCAAFLRSKLLEHQIPLLGVRFITPPLLREIIFADAASAVPLREHLRLLLAIAAESAAPNDPQDVDLTAIAKSIARAPDNLLRVFDRVSAAGWNFSSTGPSGTREIICNFQALVRKCDFKLVHQADRAAIETAKTAPQQLSDLLVVGFSAAHWPLWPLLQASVLSSKRATIVLEYPREQTRAADESWVGTWEENFGAAAPIAGQTERTRPFADVARPDNGAIDSTKREQPHFLVGINATEQAQAIVAIALKFLESKSCTRVGILFPRPGALARLVSDLLARARVPHNDAIGHLTPGEFEQPAWIAWLDMQENHRVEAVLRFLEANPESLGGLPIENVRNVLRGSYRDILIDNIDVLREYCARQTDRDEFVRIAKLLREIKFLPSKATFEQLLKETQRIFSKLNWNHRWAEIDHFARGWSSAVAPDLSRAIYLRWLKEILASFGIARAAEGNHVYSRVHLLSYAEAEGQEWSHLVLAGLNQAEWPQSTSESGFLPDDEIAKLNARAARRGAQGEGHSVLEKDKTFLLSAQDERKIALRQFAGALESVEYELAITASLLQESAPERFWNPSELFSQIYFATRRSQLSQKTMSMLQEQTHAWLEDQKLFAEATARNSDITQTRVAYDARRAEGDFGEYEFALREPIEREITLRATEWDKVVKTPALIWLKKFLGIENQDPDLNQWNAATGIWVHDWLARIAATEGQNVFVDFPAKNELCRRIGDAANHFRHMVVDLCASGDRTVPDWWTSGWGNAFALADCLGGKLAEMDGWPQMAVEWNAVNAISLNGGGKLRVRGRVDLILARERPNESQLGPGDIWIVDYKTGNVKSLSPAGRTPEARAANLRKKLVRGDAIQLGLYGLAARELGAAEISLSILSVRTGLDRPQLNLAALDEHADFWGELCRMQETGIFGLRGAIRNEFGFSPDYPLATLPIDKEFLDEKWVHTHPAFADDEDDRS
jgi:PD-(D/E)XK nuclease superfamily